MQLIRPYVEIWEQGYKEDALVEGMWSHIARCVRVCYQSEDKKSPSETDESFVKRVILRHQPWNDERNHLAMLEHGTVYLTYVRKWEGDTFVEKYEKNPYSKIGVARLDTINEEPWKRLRYCITTNLRVLVENNWLSDMKYISFPTEHHILRFTVSFTTNIGVTREFNRHRVNSPGEESTTYCNYNKRNDGQIKIALPAWLLHEEHLPYIESHQFDKLSSYCEDVLGNDHLIDNWCDIDYYLFSLTVAEFCYNALIEKGWKPKQAREVLPLATKSQLVHTAFVDDWEHFFRLRSEGISGPPHPNAKLLADDLLEKFKKLAIIQ